MNDSTQTTCKESSCNETLTDRKNEVLSQPTDTKAEVCNEGTLTTAQPAWNAERTDDGVDLEVTLPGVLRENLDLQVEGRELRLSARRENAGSSRRLILGQPAPDTYALKLRLGESLDGEQLSAALKDGILKVSVPLASEARPRTISID